MKRQTLYKFGNAHKFLDKLGIPRLEGYENNVVIEKIDLTEEENKGNIEWRDDGVYLKINDFFQRGFMYIKRPYIYYEGERKDYPKFHIVECSTIKDQKAKNNFNNRYYWSNSDKVTLTDYTTHKVFENIKLKLCSNCKNLIQKINGEKIHTTQDFHNLLKLNNETIEEENKGNLETDILGRPIHWKRISRAYRESKNYTCEECGFGGDDLENNFDKRYIHTHHIEPTDLLNTHTDNLKALCVLCHSQQDEKHIINFNKTKMQLELKNFIKKYRKKLLERGNPYVKQYLI